MEGLLLAGDILHTDGPEEGYIYIKDGIIHDVGEGKAPDEKKEYVRIDGLIIPGFIDLHTHLADLMGRNSVPRRIEDAVFPGTYKHKILENATHTQTVGSIAMALKELQPGVTDVLDFREGGIKGIMALREAKSGTDMNVIGLGRPVKGEDPSGLLDISGGLGVPSLVPGLEGLRDIARKKKKIFAIHASEAYRDDIEDIAGLDPDLVIHMVKGTRSDRKVLAEMSIPVCVCPRSNRFFDLDLPLREMMDADMMIGIGTDNSMTGKQDMFEEMRAAFELLGHGKKKREKEARQVFEMCTGFTYRSSRSFKMISRAARWWEESWPRKGESPLLTVLEKPSGRTWKKNPFSYIIDQMGQKDVLFSGPGYHAFGRHPI